jgi:Protein of unknown function (DUF2894)
MHPAQDPLAWLQSLPRPLQGLAAQPARWRVLEALARRTAAQPPGALRELLAQKLESRWCLMQQAMPPAVPSTIAATPPAAGGSKPGPLKRLLACFPDTDHPDLRSLRLDRRSFTRLRVEHRLAPLQTPPPQPVGPLNALALVPRALAILGETSPEYLQRLLAHVDALAALAPSAGGPPDEPSPPSTAAPKRKKKL